MAIRNRVTWNGDSSLSDPRLGNLRELVSAMQRGSLPPGVKGGSYFSNSEQVLPRKPFGYYKEFDVTPAASGGRNSLRIVLGEGGEIYVSGNHYTDFRQIIQML